MVEQSAAASESEGIAQMRRSKHIVLRSRVAIHRADAEWMPASPIGHARPHAKHFFSLNDSEIFIDLLLWFVAQPVFGSRLIRPPRTLSSFAHHHHFHHLVLDGGAALFPAQALFV